MRGGSSTGAFRDLTSIERYIGTKHSKQTYTGIDRFGRFAGLTAILPPTQYQFDHYSAEGASVCSIRQLTALLSRNAAGVAEQSTRSI